VITISLPMTRSARVITLKQGKNHCGRGYIITDPMAHVVADADLEQNQAFGAESIEMHVSLLTS